MPALTAQSGLLDFVAFEDQQALHSPIGTTHLTAHLPPACAQAGESWRSPQWLGRRRTPWAGDP
ncbi:hypothetical protein [Streptomyces sp. NBC_01367]|uniref:hypothetical protein n=1 Tax=Streptomyces sp. NBC_01367 TaxID=2903841 RepID=UPI0032462B44